MLSAAMRTESEASQVVSDYIQRLLGSPTAATSCLAGALPPPAAPRKAQPLPRARYAHLQQETAFSAAAMERLQVENALLQQQVEMLKLQVDTERRLRREAEDNVSTALAAAARQLALRKFSGVPTLLTDDDAVSSLGDASDAGLPSPVAPTLAASSATLLLPSGTNRRQTISVMTHVSPQVDDNSPPLRHLSTASMLQLADDEEEHQDNTEEEETSTQGEEQLVRRQRFAPFGGATRHHHKRRFKSTLVRSSKKTTSGAGGVHGRIRHTTNAINNSEATANDKALGEDTLRKYKLKKALRRQRQLQQQQEQLQQQHQRHQHGQARAEMPADKSNKSLEICAELIIDPSLEAAVAQRRKSSSALQISPLHRAVLQSSLRQAANATATTMARAQ